MMCSESTRRRIVLALVAWCSAGTVACARVSFYDVVATPAEDCVVTPAGEFCGEVGGPELKRFTVEYDEENTYLYVDEEMWLAAGIDGERVVVKEERVTQECTTLARRTLRFNIGDDDNNNEVFVGTLEEITKIDGPEICGDVPRGTRLLYTLEGQPSTSF